MDIKELLKLPRDKQLKILSKASELVENQHKERSKKRLEALERARAIKTQRAKNKIIGAMNILKLYGKKPTVRAISLESGVSKTTVQKYISSKKEANFEVDTSLKVPFEEKEEVKKLGAIWNIDKKVWVAKAGTPKKAFTKWI